MAADVGSDRSDEALWVLGTLLILMIVLGVLYFGAAFASKNTTDINVNKPGLIVARSK